MNKLNDDEIYAIITEDMRYTECVHCLCRMCHNLRSYCKTCGLCLFKAAVMRKCRWFVPFVFGREPYASYFRMTEQLRGARFDIWSRFK